MATVRFMGSQGYTMGLSFQGVAPFNPPHIPAPFLLLFKVESVFKNRNPNPPHGGGTPVSRSPLERRGSQERGPPDWSVAFCTTDRLT